MSEEVRLSTLRQKMSCIIDKVLTKPSLKEKEMNCFDSLVSRRQFLKGSGQVFVLAGLVSSGVMPSAWGSLNSDYSSNPADFGITDVDMSEEPNAYQLTFGTEMFTDTVKQTSLESSLSEQGHHALLESFNWGHLKIQAIVDEASATESNFTDTNCNYGSPTLVQLIPDSNNKPTIQIVEPTDKDSAEQSIGYKTTSIPNISFASTANKNTYECKRIIPIHSPLHNKVASDGKMYGVQAFLVDTNKETTSYLGKVYLCIRWFEAETGLGNTESSVTDWQIYNLKEKLHDQHSDLPGFRYLTDFNVHTDISGQTHITYQTQFASEKTHYDSKQDVTSQQLAACWVLTIDSWKNISHYACTTPITDFGDDWEEGYMASAKCPLVGNYFDKPLASLNHVLKEGEDKTFHIAPAEYTSVQSIEFPPSLITQEKVYKLESGCNVFFESRQYKAPYDTYSSLNSNGYAFALGLIDKKLFLNTFNYCTFDCVHEFHQTTTIKNKNTKGDVNVSFVVAKVSLWKDCDFSSAAQSSIVMMSLDADTGFLLGYRIFAQPDIAQGDPVTLCGGQSKYGGFTFFSKDENDNLLIYRQADLEAGTPFDDDPTKTMSPVYWGYTYSSCPAFMSTQTVDGELEYSGFFIGNNASAIYANPRFNQKCEYLAIKETSSNTYSALMKYNKNLEKTWVDKPIVISQSESEAESTNSETSECYCMTVRIKNSYDLPAQLSETQYIELRSTNPLTVLVNDTRTYETDRTTSALVPASDVLSDGTIQVTTLAKDMSCCMMVRIIDTANLSITSDSALLSDSSGQGVTSSWYNIILSEQSTKRASSEDYVSQDKFKTAGVENNLSIKPNVVSSEDEAYSALSSLTQTTASTLTSYTEAQDASSGETVQTLLSSSTIPASINPIYCQFVKVQNSTLQASTSASSSNDLCLNFGSNGMSYASPRNNQQLTSIWGDIKHFANDAAHAIANAVNDVLDGIDDAVTWVSQAGDTFLEVTENFLTKLGHACEQAITTVYESLDEIADSFINICQIIIDVLEVLIRVVMLLINMLLHIGDIISCINESVRVQKEGITMLQSFKEPIVNGFEDLKALVDSGLDDFSNNIDSMKSQTENAAEEAVESVVDGIMDMKKEMESVINSPFVTKIINAPFNLFTKAINALGIDDAIEEAEEAIYTTLSPILVDTSSIDVSGLISTLDADFDIDEDYIMETILEAVGKIIAALANPYDFSNIVLDLLASLIGVLKTTIDIAFNLMESIISFALDSLYGIYCDKNITLQIPFITAIVKKFDIDLSFDVSMAEVMGVYLGIVTWIYHYILEGKSVSTLPSLETLYNAGDQASFTDSSQTLQALRSNSSVSGWDAFNHSWGIGCNILSYICSFQWAASQTLGTQKALAKERGQIFISNPGFCAWDQVGISIASSLALVNGIRSVSSNAINTSGTWTPQRTCGVVFDGVFSSAFFVCMMPLFGKLVDSLVVNPTDTGSADFWRKFLRVQFTRNCISEACNWGLLIDNMAEGNTKGLDIYYSIADRVQSVTAATKDCFELFWFDGGIDAAHLATKFEYIKAMFCWLIGATAFNSSALIVKGIELYD